VSPVLSQLKKPDVAFWSIISLLLFAIVAYVTIQFIAPIIMGVFFYYCTRPIYARVNQYSPYESLSAVITILSAIIPLLIFFTYVGSIAVSELRRFLIRYDLNQYNGFLPESFTVNMTTLIQRPILLIEEANGLSPELLQRLTDWALIMVSFLSDVFLYLLLMFIVVFYLLKDDARIANWSEKNISYITPVWSLFWRRVDEDLHTVFYGNILNMIFATGISVTVYILYNMAAPPEVSLTYPVLFGVLAGFASIIPIIGVKVIYVPITLYLFIVSFAAGDIELFGYVTLFVIVSASLVDFVPDIILRPYMSGKNLHLGLLLFAYISGPVLLGWYGFFLAPIVLVVITEFSSIMLPRILPAIFETDI
jgi:predicted PurR-regulated permease PerM